MIAIIDHGYANIQSLYHSLNKLEKNVLVTSNYKDIMDSSALILPGVGAFQPAMEELKIKKLDQKICDFAKTGKLIFGICLGMQLLSSRSFEFGVYEGLNLVPGEVEKINENSHKRIPNVGWYKINLVKKGLQKFEGDLNYYYFTHSYEFKPLLSKHVLFDINFGKQKVVAGVIKDNIIGTQFHPEKSGRCGLKLLSKILCDV